MTDRERDEMLIRMDERLHEIYKALDRDYKHIHGNGQPGLLTRVQQLEDIHANDNKWTKKAGGFLAWIASTAIAIFALIKHH